MTAPGPQKATFLIVPGSFSTPQAYDVLVAQLRSQGYEARATDLLSANDGTRIPPATGEDDVVHIRQQVLAILDSDTHPSDVVVAGHSYGGIPTTSALAGLNRADRSAQGKTTAVTGIVYIASFLIPPGQSNREFMNTEAEVPEPARVGVPGGYMPAIDPSFARAFVFNDVESDEAAEAYLGMFTRHSSDSFDFKTTYEAWRDIPSVYLIPGNDLVIPTQLQLTMFERAVAERGKITKVFIEGAGHCLNFTQPKLVAAEMIKCTESQA